MRFGRLIGRSLDNSPGCISPRRPGRICSRTCCVPEPYGQRADLLSDMEYGCFQLTVLPGRAGAGPTKCLYDLG
jgi:hypothetical protein